MKQRFKILCAVSTLAFVTCTSNPKSHEAEVTAAQEVAHTEADAIYTIANNSVITWVGTKPTGRHNGTIAISSGHLAINNKAVVGGSFTMDMTTIEAVDLKGDLENYEKLLVHLSSADFFDVENNPTSEFVISGISDYTRSVGEEAADTEFTIADPTHFITGNFSLKDTTLSITFPAKLQLTKEGLKAKAKFNIDRTRWGVSYRDESAVVDKAKDKFIYNKVNIGFDIIAKK